MADKTNDDLLNTSISEQLSKDAPLADNTSKSNIKDLPNVPVISNISDASVVENSRYVNSLDR